MSQTQDCTQCGTRKPLSEFHFDGSKNNGVRSACKVCVSARQKERRLENRTRLGDSLTSTMCLHCGRSFTYTKRGAQRLYCNDAHRYAAQKTLNIARRARYVRQCGCGSTDVERVGKAICRDCRTTKKNTRLLNRRYNLKTLYGLTPEAFDQLLLTQEGRCAICGTDDPTDNKGAINWHVDHDHSCCPRKGSCGKCIRGLLCGRCNIGLGGFRDDPVVLANAAQYVRNFRKVTSPLLVVG